MNIPTKEQIEERLKAAPWMPEIDEFALRVLCLLIAEPETEMLKAGAEVIAKEYNRETYHPDRENAEAAFKAMRDVLLEKARIE